MIKIISFYSTKSLTSILIHTGINILSEGAPIPVSGLESDLGIKDIKEFALEVMKNYSEEVDDIVLASTKSQRCIIMLKDTDKYENDYNSLYIQRIQKKVKRTPNKDVMIFASVFIIGVLIILGFAKILSPNVDVGITVDNEIASSVEDESTGSVIDDRLKRFQLEDTGKKR